MKYRRLYSEISVSLSVGILSLVCWQGILPAIGITDLIRKSQHWGDLGAIVIVGVTYYAAIVASLAFVRRYDPRVHPLSAAFLGGWWVLAISTYLGIYFGNFNEVLGVPLQSMGTFFLFFALFIGLLRYWREMTLVARFMSAKRAVEAGAEVEAGAGAEVDPATIQQNEKDKQQPI